MAMLSSLSTEDLIPVDHPIRRIRVVVDTVLADLDDTFESMYSTQGRASVPPEQLLKATVLMAMYSMRSERAFCERLNYDMLFKWFLGLAIDAKSFDATTFTKNRERLLEHAVADEFFAAVVKPYLANKKDNTFLDDYLIGSDLKQFLEPWRREQFRRIRRPGTAHQRPETIDRGIPDRIRNLGLTRDDRRHPDVVFEPEQFVCAGTAEIGVYQQYPLARIGN